MAAIWHKTHRPNPIDPDDDPALMCLNCLACACCEPARATALCSGVAEGFSFLAMSYPSEKLQS